ncbi:MAG: pilus assembly protein PilM [Candidatus Kuenenbacteria bacterium]
MNFITPPTKIFGLDLSDLSVKAVQIREKKDQFELQAWNSSTLPSGLIEEGIIKDFKETALAIKKLIRTSQKEFTAKYVVLSLPETKTFIKVIKAPKQKGSQREAIIRELPKHVPVDIQDIELDWQKLTGRDSGKFLIGIVPKKVADGYIRVAKMAGLRPVALEIEAQAVVRSIIASENFNQKNLIKNLFGKNKNEGVSPSADPARIILDLGATRTSLILLDGGVIQFTNSLSNISGEIITQDIAKIMELPCKEAEKIKKICGDSPKKCKGEIKKIIKTTVAALASEVINAEAFYTSHFNKNTKDLEIILCSGGSNLIGISNDLEKLTNRKTVLANPLVNLGNTNDEKAKKIFSPYTTAIGLALYKVN